MDHLSVCLSFYHLSVNPPVISSDIQVFTLYSQIATHQQDLQYWPIYGLPVFDVQEPSNIGIHLQDIDNLSLYGFCGN